ncbi:unnamed protein product [Peronospora belbahrii]|uniref:Uncharacterized protein n=1 Tax=Peronospora belbahrii TaxID=622444 RepID=A0AAU9KL64_9STRA|nr:unnamed protein product [Peronospora belbahrii]CAH0520710.1 unnamed protein product [Peronospora belbahrii]
MSLEEQNEEAQPLTAEDQLFFDVVKSTFGDQDTDDLAIQVAHAYRNVKKNRKQFTISETKKILDVRAALDIDNILKNDLPMSKVYNENWPTYVNGEDKEGHLVTVDRLSDINPDGLFEAFANANEILPAWKVISANIEPKTCEKIQVFKHMKTFLEVAQNNGLPLSSLPSYMGGSHPERRTNSTFTASEPNTPFPVPVTTTLATKIMIPFEAADGPEARAGT